MWRWLHSLPRAVRNHFHSPGASAGVNVEDKYDVGSQTRCEVWSKQKENFWRRHCKHSSKWRKEEEGKQRQDPEAEKIDLNQIYGKHSPAEAFGWGGALAIGIQLSKLHGLYEECRKKDVKRCNCPIYKVVHALPAIVTQTTAKKSVLQIDQKRHEDNSKEDIFEFTLNRIEQELLQELARKTQDPVTILAEKDRCCRKKEAVSKEKPEWAKVIVPEASGPFASFDNTFSQSFSPNISVIKNLGKDLLGTLTEENCTDNSSKSNSAADEKFNILDITQQVKRRQSVSDTVHWLPNGFSLPQPNFGRDIVNKRELSRNQKEKYARPKNTTVKNKKSKEFQKLSEPESLEKVFEDFTKVCQDYTATGKSMMGVQEAMQGNMKCAVELWEESSMLGNAKALYNLGMCYETGKGVEKNIGQAVKFYTLAAEANHPEALYNLGLVYLEGSCGVPKDHKLGLEMLQQAATQGLAEAQRYLGVFYTGEGQEDWETAVHYFRQAANQKDRESQYYLGLCYEEGCGVPENTCKAAHYYKLAADQGHDEAQYRLGLFHLHGLGGLPMSTSSGMELIQAAADQGHEEARTDLQLLKEKEEKQKETHTDRTAKLSTSISLPSLSDQISNSFSLIQEPVYSGNLSQLFRDLMLPGFTDGAPVAPADSEAGDSDSSVVFALDFNDTELETSTRSIDSDDDFDEWMGNICRAPLGPRRNYTMPDLHVVSCF